MALPLLASVDDLALEPGLTIDLDDLTAVARAEAVLRKASTLVRTYKGQTWVDADTGDLVADIPDAVGEVVLTVTARVLRNPNGHVQEMTGPYERSFGAAAAEGLYLTKSEKVMLDGGSARSGLGTISVQRDEAEAPVFVYPDDGGEPILVEGGWSWP